MRKQIISAMLLLLALILPVSLYLQIGQSFRMSVSNAREGALHEEAVIARAMITEISKGMRESDEALFQAAQKTQQQFSSGRLRIMFYAEETALTGTELSDSALKAGLLNVTGRSTYLSSEDETLYVIHPLDDRIRLITASDFSGFYTMRRKQTTYGVLICLGGMALAAVLAFLFSRGITRSLNDLSLSADAVRKGAAFTLQSSGKQDEIGRLTDAFIAMNDAVEKREESLREQARQRQQLIDALAHEMRTPLTSIVSAARLIQKDTSGAGLREEMCDLIVRESRRLSDMDENLMKLTRMNGAEPKVESFSLKEAALEALAVTPETELSGEDCRVTADRALVIHLMRNLVNNAGKSGTKSPVRVTLHLRGFSVSDEGRGMTEEEVRQCTEPFWKADPARTRASGGAGLGLTICREIADLHHAALEIRSVPGQGTTVDFTLPLHPDEDSETASLVSCD